MYFSVFLSSCLFTLCLRVYLHAYLCVPVCLYSILSACLCVCFYAYLTFRLPINVPLGPMMASISPPLAIPETRLRIVLALTVTVTS